MTEEQTCATCQHYAKYGQWCTEHKAPKKPTESCEEWTERWLK